MKHNINFEWKKYFIPSELPGKFKEKYKIKPSLGKIFKSLNDCIRVKATAAVRHATA